MKKQSLKTSVLALLLVLFLAQGGIGYWVLQHRLWLVKKEMKALVLGNIDEDRLTPIHLSAQEFQELEWPEPWEFLYQGKMYDISRKEFHNDGSVTLFAILDTEENQLKALVRSLVKNSSDKKQTQEQLNFFYKFQSQWVCDFESIHIPNLECQLSHFNLDRLFISSPHVRLNELPPNC
ncbi:MAG: hypothetical protein RLZZ71_2017 [Bacteroidota bacterium]|jgi:hypothetical protein